METLTWTEWGYIVGYLVSLGIFTVTVICVIERRKERRRRNRRHGS